LLHTLKVYFNVTYVLTHRYPNRLVNADSILLRYALSISKLTDVSEELAASILMTLMILMTFMTEAAHSSETAANIYQSTRGRVPET
jgi:hypothetical protein